MLITKNYIKDKIVFVSWHVIQARLWNVDIRNFSSFFNLRQCWIIKVLFFVSLHKPASYFLRNLLKEIFNFKIDNPKCLHLHFFKKRDKGTVVNQTCPNMKDHSKLRQQFSYYPPPICIHSTLNRDISITKLTSPPNWKIIESCCWTIS